MEMSKLSLLERPPTITLNPMLKEGLVERAAFLHDANYVEEKDANPDDVDDSRSTFAAYMMGVNGDQTANETSIRAFIMNNPGNAERS